jgi:hypothetical protein
MLCFANPGIIDVRCITTAGLSVKESANPIGRFGTGLKNAIAIVLRLGGTITINTGDGDVERTYNFTTVKETVRGKEFSFIHMETIFIDEGMSETRELGFTTSLAQHWEPWMAYRELRSNALDEGGEVYTSDTLYTQWDGPATEIIVDCPEIEAAHDQTGLYFLETKPLWSSPELEIHPANLHGSIFYRGIRVAQAVDKGLYTYNILSAQNLTEDRTLDLWHCGYAIVKALGAVDNDNIAERILLAPYGTYEHNLDFDYTSNFSEAMRKAIALHHHNESINASARRRSRALYREDYAPIAIPITDDQRQQVTQVRELFQAFRLPFPWQDIRPTRKRCEDDDDIITHGDILWIDEAKFAEPDWLAYIMGEQWFNQEYDYFRNEKRMLHLMAVHLPELPVLAGYLYPEPKLQVMPATEEDIEAMAEYDGFEPDETAGVSLDQVPYTPDQ